MPWWMLSVDSWLDVAPLENMEKDRNLLFLVPEEEFNEDFSWDFWIIIFFLERFGNLEFFFFFKELKILIDDFFFFKAT